MAKRFCILFFITISVFFVLVLQLSLLATNENYAYSTENQVGHYLELEQGRGNFYDSSFRQLTSNTYSNFALVSPTVGSYRQLFDYINEDDKADFYKNIQKSTPFLVEMEANAELDLPMFQSSQRYMSLPIANQLIGYIDSEGAGVSGLELAFNESLENGASTEQIFCAVNAQGEFIDVNNTYVTTQTGTGFGVILTIDAALQRLCEAVAQNSMEMGAIVITDTKTGRVRASVSMPMYDPSDVEQSLTSEGSPFTNRVISSYNVGSVFKPLLAALAIENDYPIDEPFTCTGSIRVSDHTYKCINQVSHGEMTLRDALAVSCNTYFVNLGLSIGGDAIYDAMLKTGFGQNTVIADGFLSSSGNIPTAEELENLGELATISFGQGTLTASPLQVTSFMNSIANGGVYVSPTFVEGYVDGYNVEVTESLYEPVMQRWISEDTANTLQLMLINTVNMGLGQSAKPVLGGAGGKTGTAQTGRYLESGEEVLDAWFSGFYPSYDPQYTITIMLDSSTKSSDDAGKIFAEVANALYYFL